MKHNSPVEKMIRMGLFMVALAAGGSTSAARDDVRTFKNDYIQIEYLNPDSPRSNPVADCRFLRAGYLTQIRLGGNNRNLLRSEPLVAYHPIVGFALEWLPSLPTQAVADGDYIERFKPGVGVIEEHVRNRFRIRPKKLAQWSSTIKEDAQVLRIISKQNMAEFAQYGYELTVETVLSKDAPVIEIVQSMRNTGSRRLTGSFYWHPFFNAPEGFDHLWVKVPELKSGSNRLRLCERRIEAREFLIPAHKVSTGNPLNNGKISMESLLPLSALEIWNNKVDLFAIEPFVAVDLAPGEEFKQVWRTTFTKNGENE